MIHLHVLQFHDCLLASFSYETLQFRLALRLRIRYYYIIDFTVLGYVLVVSVQQVVLVAYVIAVTPIVWVSRRYLDIYRNYEITYFFVPK